jgi:hypothetical protein
VGEPEGKRLLGRKEHRWVVKVKMNVREIGWGGMDWIDLAQDEEHGKEPSGSVILLEVID